MDNSGPTETTGFHDWQRDRAAASFVKKNFSEPGKAEILARTLREAGMQTHAFNPIVMAWAELNVTPEHITEAIALARIEKPAPERLVVGYLKPIVHSILNPKPDKGPGWWTSDQLTDAEARRMGVYARAGEDYHQFRARLRELKKKAAK